MYAAFNTLQLELERLLLLKQSMAAMNCTINTEDNMKTLDNKIRSHEKAIKLLNRQHQAEQRTVVLAANCP